MTQYECSNGRGSCVPGEICVRKVDSDSPKHAAEEYVELHLADLDYPEQIEVWVKTSETGYRLFDVTVRPIPQATAKEKTRA